MLGECGKLLRALRAAPETVRAFVAKVGLLGGVEAKRANAEAAADYLNDSAQSHIGNYGDDDPKHCPLNSPKFREFKPGRYKTQSVNFSSGGKP